MEKSYDVVVIGSGVGGYSTAIRLRHRGYSVAIVEMDKIGGECVNYGCVPTKALFTIAKALNILRDFTEISIDTKSLFKWRNNIVSRVRDGIEYLLNRYGVDIYRGLGIVKSRNRIEVRNQGKEIELNCRYIVIASGSDPKQLPNIPFDGRKILSNRDIALCEELPQRILVVGAGAIGVELLFTLKTLGFDVYAVEAIDVLPGFDRDLSRFIKRKLRARGIDVKITTVSKVVDRGSEGLEVHLANGERLDVDAMIVTIGRTPRSRGFGLESIGIEIDDKGFIKIDEFNRTNVENIYALGDVVGGPLLAHKAFIESHIVANAITGRSLWTIDRNYIPMAIFSIPPIASIGLSEDEARKRGYDVEVYRLPLASSARSIIEKCEDCFIKIVIDKKTRNVLGIHIASPNAEEVINLAMEIMVSRIGFEDIAKRPYVHLSIGEMMRDLVELVLGEPIHVYLRR